VFYPNIALYKYILLLSTEITTKYIHIIDRIRLFWLNFDGLTLWSVFLKNRASPAQVMPCHRLPHHVLQGTQAALPYDDIYDMIL
jgi:hypothetical protein